MHVLRVSPRPFWNSLSLESMPCMRATNSKEWLGRIKQDTWRRIRVRSVCLVYPDFLSMNTCHVKPASTWLEGRWVARCIPRKQGWYYPTCLNQRNTVLSAHAQWDNSVSSFTIGNYGVCYCFHTSVLQSRRKFLGLVVRSFRLAARPTFLITTLPVSLLRHEIFKSPQASG